MINTLRLLLALLLALSGGVTAQTCIYTVDSSPYGTVPAGAQGARLYQPWGAGTYHRIHLLVPMAVFQNVPHRITDIAVGARSGWFTYRFSEVTIRMGHTTATQLNAVFAQNITSPLQDVLVVRDHVWTEGFGPAWVPLGLQQSFQLLPGSGNLLVEIITRDAIALDQGGYNDLATGNVGTMLSNIGATMPTLGNAPGPAPRLRFCTDRAEVSLLGQTCNGSANSTPLLGVTGRPTLGAQPTLWLSDAPPNAIAACAFGFDTTAPYPIDLTALGAPGCRQYFPIAVASVVIASNLGIGQQTLPVPSAAATIGAVVYAQWWVLDPPANALDLTSSNYARLLVGL